MIDPGKVDSESYEIQEWVHRFTLPREYLYGWMPLAQ